MKELYKSYCRVEEIVCGILFVAIIALVFSSAFLRLFAMPLIWADDIAKLCFAWVAFLGADVAMRYCRLVGVDAIMVRLKPKLRKILYIVGNIVILGILIAFVFYGIRLSIANWERYFQTIPVSYSWVTLCLPVGSACMILTTLIKIAKLFIHLNDDDYTLAGEVQANEPEDVERQVI